MEETLLVPLNELVLDAPFDNDELIIEVDEFRMATIRREASDSDGIWICRYDLTNDSGNVSANYNGRNELGPGQKDHGEYLDKLDHAGLW